MINVFYCTNLLEFWIYDHNKDPFSILKFKRALSILLFIIILIFLYCWFQKWAFSAWLNLLPFLLNLLHTFLQCSRYWFKEIFSLIQLISGLYSLSYGSSKIIIFLPSWMMVNNTLSECSQYQSIKCVTFIIDLLLFGDLLMLLTGIRTDSLYYCNIYSSCPGIHYLLHSLWIHQLHAFLQYLLFGVELKSIGTSCLVMQWLYRTLIIIFVI